MEWQESVARACRTCASSVSPGRNSSACCSVCNRLMLYRIITLRQAQRRVDTEVTQYKQTRFTLLLHCPCGMRCITLVRFVQRGAKTLHPNRDRSAHRCFVILLFRHCVYFLSMRNSTRRFFFRASSDVFGICGADSPTPFAVSCCLATPCSTK